MMTNFSLGAHDVLPFCSILYALRQPLRSGSKRLHNWHFWSKSRPPVVQIGPYCMLCMLWYTLSLRTARRPAAAPSRAEWMIKRSSPRWWTPLGCLPSLLDGLPPTHITHIHWKDSRTFWSSTNSGIYSQISSNMGVYWVVTVVRAGQSKLSEILLVRKKQLYCQYLFEWIWNKLKYTVWRWKTEMYRSKIIIPYIIPTPWVTVGEVQIKYLASAFLLRWHQPPTFSARWWWMVTWRVLMAKRGLVWFSRVITFTQIFFWIPHHICWTLIITCIFLS